LALKFFMKEVIALMQTNSNLTSQKLRQLWMQTNSTTYIIPEQAN
ncbi:25371_t:CDS:2, partial [Gigaspora margarita]